MKANLMSNLIYPMLRRVGSVIAGGLVVYGATAEQAAAIEGGFIALATIAVDLYFSYRNRKGK